MQVLVPLGSTMLLVLSGISGLFFEVLLYQVSALRQNLHKDNWYADQPACPVCVENQT
jgi:hypothetical protein